MIKKTLSYIWEFILGLLGGTGATLILLYIFKGWGIFPTLLTCILITRHLLIKLYNLYDIKRIYKILLIIMPAIFLITLTIILTLMIYIFLISDPDPIYS